MLSEKDKAVVASMVRTGMDLETLKSIFPKFDKRDIEEVYKEGKNKKEEGEELHGGISCNCS